MPSEAAINYNARRSVKGHAVIGGYYHPSTVICAERHYGYAFDKIVENIVNGINFDGEVPKVNARDAIEVYDSTKELTAREMINTITYHARWAKITYEELAVHVRALYRAGKEIAG